MVVLPAAPASADVAPCRVTYDAYPGGAVFDVFISIFNTGTVDILGWTLSFVLPPGQEVVRGSEYGVIIEVDGGTVRGRNAPWNPDVRVDGRVNLGFKVRGADHTAEPGEFRVNGQRCDP